MTGDINFFRKRVFGGFNREDVVSYIAMMAKERSELEAAKDKAENDVKALAREVAAFRLEAEEVMRLIRKDNEHKAAVFENAGDTFSELEIAFKMLRQAIETAATDVYTELKNAGETISRLPYELAQAGERMKELRTAFFEKRTAGAEGEAYAKREEPQNPTALNPAAQNPTPPNQAASNQVILTTNEQNTPDPSTAEPNKIESNLPEPNTSKPNTIELIKDEPIKDESIKDESIKDEPIKDDPKKAETDIAGRSTANIYRFKPYSSMPNSAIDNRIEEANEFGQDYERNLV